MRNLILKVQVSEKSKKTSQNPVPPVNIPIPTKKDENGWCTYPKIVQLVLTHSHITPSLPGPGLPVPRHGRGCPAPLVLAKTLAKAGAKARLSGPEAAGMARGRL